MATSRVVRIAVCQTRSDFASAHVQEPRESNAARAVALMHQGASRGADICIFGEVFLNGYGSGDSLPRLATSVERGDPFLDSIIAASRETGVWAIVGFCRRGDDGIPGLLFNSAGLISPAGLEGYYDKVHIGSVVLPDGRAISESTYWTPGSEFPVFKTPWGTIGLLICRDIRYPEAARVLTLKGAELIVTVAAPLDVFVGGDHYYHEFWDVMSRARAIENQLWMVVASIIGRDGDVNFYGGSRIVGPRGAVLASAEDNVEQMLVEDLDLDDVYRTRALTHVFDTRVPQSYLAIVGDNRTSQ